MIQCCLCGGRPETNANASCLSLTNWAAQWEEISRTECAVEVGRRGPWEHGEGTESTLTFFRVCPACFHGKVVPWFATQGAQPEVVEYARSADRKNAQPLRPHT